MYEETDIQILELALKQMTMNLDTLIGKCLDDEGKEKAPSKQDLMRMRGFLPSYCKHSLTKGK